MSAIPVAINDFEIAAFVNQQVQTCRYVIVAKSADNLSRVILSSGKQHAALTLHETENRQEAHSRLDELARLERNWDACGADAMDEICVRNAKKLIDALPEKTPSPEIFPNPNGTLTLDWETTEQMLSLELGKNRFSSYWETKQDTKMAEGEISKSIPDFVYIALQEMFPDVAALPEQIQEIVIEDNG